VNFAQAIANQTRNTDDTVCPTNLRSSIFTVAALDNIDHNPTPRTASSAFHGTGWSIFQFPTSQKPGLEQERLQINSKKLEYAAVNHAAPFVYVHAPCGPKSCYPTTS